MKPKIKTRLANLMARLAGSDDYDPKVKPITPLEFYLDQFIASPLPVVSIPIRFLQPDDPEEHWLNISDSAFDAYFRTGLIKYRLDGYDAENYIRTSAIITTNAVVKTLEVQHLYAVNPLNFDDGFLSYNFSIFKYAEGRYTVIGQLTEV